MNYNSFYNKPTLNHKELIGDNKASDIGGMTEEDMQELLKTDLTPYYSKDEIDDLFARSFVYREKSGSIVTFDCPSTSQSIPEVTVGIEATQSGSGDPSPTNVRPITGWSAVNRYRRGKNLATRESLTSSSNGGLDANIRIGNAIEGIQYTISADSLETNEKIIRVYIGSTEITTVATSAWTANNRNSVTFTAPISGEIGLGTNRETFSNSTKVLDNIQIELGDQATTYEAFSGTTYTTTLKDGQGNPLTCYGGELSNENGVQTLTVTHANIASYNGETINEPWISSMDVYSEGVTPTTGAEVVYELATPIQIPQDNLAIATQDGVNNLWADTGDIEVKCLDRIIPAGE